jgi:hypothetical protein
MFNCAMTKDSGTRIHNKWLTRFPGVLTPNYGVELVGQHGTICRTPWRCALTPEHFYAKWYPKQVSTIRRRGARNN